MFGRYGVIAELIFEYLTLRSRTSTIWLKTVGTLLLLRWINLPKSGASRSIHYFPMIFVTDVRLDIRQQCSIYGNTVPLRCNRVERESSVDAEMRRNAACFSFRDIRNRNVHDIDLRTLEWAMVKCKYVDQKPIYNFLFDDNNT